MMDARWTVVLASLAAARIAAAIDLAACGQVIPAGRTAELRTDLVCAAGPTWPFSARGVRLEPGAKLRMNGFTIVGDGTGVGVECTSRRCTILGPGEIRGFFAGVNCGGCRVVARDVVVRENTEGIYVPLSGAVDAKRVVASDNTGSGIWAQTLKGSDVEAGRNGANGVAAITQLRLRRLVAVGNGDAGVRAGAGRSRLRDSEVTGNAEATDGYDVTATGTVRLVRTTCGRSAKLHYTSQEEYDVVGSFGCADD
jgi:hypothetical protein